eukprot:TRINITY_DN13729_c0_g2_i1.p1 TRINITY_DN13729_c0_g2~~TRINITY_DN13729_c0_g2_i1.p1  ORF type:complete len:102 (+),score=13.23 TRINITY_DN13729_c0_g2_i1:303-608(+)
MELLHLNPSTYPEVLSKPINICTAIPITVVTTSLKCSPLQSKPFLIYIVITISPSRNASPFLACSDSSPYLDPLVAFLPPPSSPILAALFEALEALPGSLI